MQKLNQKQNQKENKKQNVKEKQILNVLEIWTWTSNENNYSMKMSKKIKIGFEWRFLLILEEIIQKLIQIMIKGIMIMKKIMKL
ncbi:MAG: hypothetical protein EZS28_001001 [Streblomastix strix]|uniref:Uncharacterized protein n=1 Tax=Streblomastix strix TaxID=222440 RepID=A0A5J4XAD8_9EUKA|nr:MAG: hypothetical protein EZS28_001001 [Streblomastix strix]